MPIAALLLATGVLAQAMLVVLGKLMVSKRNAWGAERVFVATAFVPVFRPVLAVELLAVDVVLGKGAKGLTVCGVVLVVVLVSVAALVLPAGLLDAKLAKPLPPPPHPDTSKSSATARTTVGDAKIFIDQ
jgi:hypothetical protein